MAKNKTLPPSRGKSKQGDHADETKSEPAEPVPVVDRRMPIETVEIKIPMAGVNTGFRQSRLDVVVPQASRETLARLVAGLRNSEATTSNGREVNNGSHAIVWLLEVLGKS